MTRDLTAMDMRITQAPRAYWNVKPSEFTEPELPVFLAGMKDYYRAGNGLFISGPPDSGKTRLTVLALKCARLHNYSAHWIRSIEIVKSIARHEIYDDGSESFPILRRYQRVDWLAIDDLGSELAMKYLEGNPVMDLIVHRAEWGKPTIITTAMQPDRIAERYPNIEKWTRGSLRIDLPSRCGEVVEF